MYVGVINLTKKSFDETHAYVYIVDETQEVMEKLNSSKNVTYIKENLDLTTQINSRAKGDDKMSILHIPKDFYVTEKVDFLRSEEHTSELQSRENIVCRLLLEK